MHQDNFYLDISVTPVPQETVDVIQGRSRGLGVHMDTSHLSPSVVVHCDILFRAQDSGVMAAITAKMKVSIF